MGRPIGAQNKDKPFRDALRMALAEATPKGMPALRRVAQSLIGEAITGDVQAIREIADRIDGKVPQAVTGSDDGDPIIVVIRKFSEDK